MSRELGLRIVTALVLFVAVVLWLFRAPDPWFQLILGLFAIAATTELLTLVKLFPLRWFGLVAASVWAFVLVGGSPMVALLMLWLVWGALVLLFARQELLVAQFHALAAASVMMVWLLFFVWMVLQLHHHFDGTLFLAGACLAVWASDIAAYFAGRAWGRRKLAPAVSPGKSIEGFQAGVLAGTLVGAAFWHATIGLGLLYAVAIGVVVTVAGVAGDLMESALKRSVGAKDSGIMLPGHGGLLDRIDALLPSIPLAGMIWLKLVS
ncbi:MAG: phosphatidate cytidylyltransferase [Mariprofundales bacterium]|nr:phosphatidate cytidylyltransferase [Mariprofundales bacterium]